MMLEFSIQPLTTWLHLHPHWSGVITFLVAFTESMAIIGSIVPGSVTMIAIGILAGAGVVPVWTIFIYAIIGAIAGDGISFWIGAHFHQELKERWPFKKYPFLLQKGEDFFERHGGKSIVIGRFIGPLRSIIPVVAGMLSMKPLNFLVANIISSILWSLVHLLPGIIIGAAAADLSPKTATYLTIVIILALALIWLLTSLFKVVTFWIIKFLNSNVNDYWSLMRKHAQLQKFAVFISDPKSPSNYAQLGLTLLFISCSVLLLFLCFGINHFAFIAKINSSTFHVLQSYRSTALDSLLVSITFGGQLSVLITLWIVMAAWFLLQGQTRTLLHWLTLGLLTFSSVEILRNLLSYHKLYDLYILHKHDTFPSAHVAFSITILGFLSYLIASKLNHGIRRFIYIPFAIIIGLISISRMYLGAHFLIDIVGGGLLGIALLFATIVSYRRKWSTNFSVLPLFLVFIFTYSISWVIYFELNFYPQLEAYTPKYAVNNISYENWWSNNLFGKIPEFRNNRLGEKAALLNIQWASSLEDIKNSLLKHGWKEPEDSPLENLINRITASNPERHMPVLQPLYNNHPPALTLLKDLGNNKPLLMLNLWKSYYRFNDKTMPLWLGTINYMLIWHPWHIHHTKIFPQLSPPLKYFYPDLADYKVRKIRLKTNIQETINTATPYSPIILLIAK